jgi:hypothetical protein
VDNNNFWGLQLTNNTLQWAVLSGGAAIVNIAQTWNPADATWYHVALVKNGATGYLHFIDGTQIGSTTTDTSTLPNFAADLRVGLVTGSSGSNNYHNGWLEEVRVSKGIARWTGNFTPPTAPYGVSQTEFFLFF